MKRIITLITAISLMSLVFASWAAQVDASEKLLKNSSTEAVDVELRVTGNVSKTIPLQLKPGQVVTARELGIENLKGVAIHAKIGHKNLKGSAVATAVTLDEKEIKNNNVLNVKCKEENCLIKRCTPWGDC